MHDPRRRLFRVGEALPVRDLTTSTDDSYPSFAPDGRSVVFERGGVLRVVATGGGAARRLVRGSQPTWGG